MGIGILLLSFYQGFATAATNILFGNIFGVSGSQLLVLLAIGLIVVVVMGIWYRPLLFASIDPETAEARGVRVRRLGLIFLLVLALTVTGAAQVVGTLLVLSLAITPAAAAQRLSASPLAIGGLSVLFAVAAADGGLLVSFEVSNVKASVFITSLSFAIYLLARLAGPMLRDAGSTATRATSATTPSKAPTQNHCLPCTARPPELPRQQKALPRRSRPAATRGRGPRRISNRAHSTISPPSGRPPVRRRVRIAGPARTPAAAGGMDRGRGQQADPIQVIGEPPGIHGAGAHPPSSRSPQPGCWATALNNAACGGLSPRGRWPPPRDPAAAGAPPAGTHAQTGAAIAKYVTRTLRSRTVTSPPAPASHRRQRGMGLQYINPHTSVRIRVPR